jgi:hypothetical protein
LDADWQVFGIDINASDMLHLLRDIHEQRDAQVVLLISIDPNVDLADVTVVAPLLREKSGDVSNILPSRTSTLKSLLDQCCRFFRTPPIPRRVSSVYGGTIRPFRK